jgi:transposase
MKEDPMSRPETPVKDAREILRLSLGLKLSANEIHRITGVSRGSVQRIVRSAHDNALEWPAVRELQDQALQDLLSPSIGNRNGDDGKETEVSGEPKFPELDHEQIKAELKRKGVTLKLLWKERFRKHPQGYYSYPQFCRLFGRWAGKIDVVMLQDHKAGDKLFVDFAGQTLRIVDRDDGTVTYAQIFIAVMGASNYSYVRACQSQDLPSWIDAHVRALEYLGGVPNFLIPDNLKSAVTEAERFDPFVNRTYRRLAEHYDCIVDPARKYRARDKAKVEKGVQVVEQRILAALRDHDFFSLEQLNDTLEQLVEDLNDEPFQQLSGSRRTWFEQVDLPALKPLPLVPFEFEHWIIGTKVPNTYHVTVERHRYSVPYRFTGEYVDIRYTDTVVEVFCNNTRIASHARSNAEGKKTSREEHMPPSHAEYYGATPEKFLSEARSVGPATTQVIKAVLASKPYPQLSFDHCYGILRYLKDKHGPEKLEAACGYAIRLGSPAYRVVKEVLLAGLDRLPVQLTLRTVRALAHPNIRGPEHFTQQGE